MHPLIHIVQKIGFQYQGANDTAASMLRTIEPKKNHIILYEGQVNHRVYFIEKGLVCQYITKGNKLYIKRILPENNLLLVPGSFFDRSPSQETIQVLEDSILHSITLDELNKLTDLHPGLLQDVHRINSIYRKRENDKIDNYMLLKENKRYARMLEVEPELVHRCSNQVIAAYLDISINTFNKSKSDLGRKK